MGEVPRTRMPAGPRGLAIGMTVAALLAVGGTAGAHSSRAHEVTASRSTSPVTARHDDTSTNAAFYVAGYLWSDGWGASPHFGFWTPQHAIAHRFTKRISCDRRDAPEFSLA